MDSQSPSDAKILQVQVGFLCSDCFRAQYCLGLENPVQSGYKYSWFIVEGVCTFALLRVIICGGTPVFKDATDRGVDCCIGWVPPLWWPTSLVGGLLIETVPWVGVMVPPTGAERTCCDSDRGSCNRELLLLPRVPLVCPRMGVCEISTARLVVLEDIVSFCGTRQVCTGGRLCVVPVSCERLLRSATTNWLQTTQMIFRVGTLRRLTLRCSACATSDFMLRW